MVNNWHIKVFKTAELFSIVELTVISLQAGRLKFTRSAKSCIQVSMRVLER